jgi:serine phosphatase RsbU (regulator of sigma subunit)
MAVAMTIGTRQSEIEISLYSAFLYNRCSTLWPPCGFIERLDVGGLPLGIQADARYESASVVLAPGDWLVIFTDGLVEAVNVRDEEYDERGCCPQSTREDPEGQVTCSNA